MDNHMALLKVPQVAEILGLGRSATYQLIRSGQLPAVRLARKAVRVRREALEAFILARESVASA